MEEQMILNGNFAWILNIWSHDFHSSFTDWVKFIGYGRVCDWLGRIKLLAMLLGSFVRNSMFIKNLRTTSCILFIKIKLHGTYLKNFLRLFYTLWTLPSRFCLYQMIQRYKYQYTRIIKRFSCPFLFVTKDWVISIFENRDIN